MSAPHSSRTAQIRCRERIVDEQRQSVLVRDRCDSLDIEHVSARVPDRLAEESLGGSANRRLPGAKIVRIDPRQLHIHLAQHVLELIYRAAVQRRRRDDMVTRCEEREERRRLCRQSAGERYRAAATLETRDTLFEHRERRVHDPRVGVAVLLEIEVGGSGVRVLEDVARGLKNRHRARTGIRIRSLTGVKLAGLEPEVA